MSDREMFLAGARPDDVLMFFAEDAVSDVGAIADIGETVEDGVVLVVDGEQGRNAFRTATGLDPMNFAKDAMDTEGTVDPGCTGGTCPASGEGDDPHDARFVFAFAEEQNAEAGGLYAEGDVIHAYVACSCGESYSDKWVAGEREA